MVIRARPGVFQGVPHSIIRNGLDPDRDLNAFTHVFLSWWTLKFQFGQHSKITWDTPNYAQGPWHSLVQICTTVDMCQRNIGALTRPLSLPPTCISAHCLGLLWLCACETSVTPFFFAHCVNLCHQLEPCLVGQRQDKDWPTLHSFHENSDICLNLRLLSVLKKGTMHQNLVWHSHDLRWSWTSFARRKRNLVHWQCMAGNRSALQCILVNISKHK